ncbi:MAG: Fic family protein [Patescibacteria group bacterium]
MFKPSFAITPKMNTQIAQIEQLKTLVDQAIILPELEVQLRFRATVETVHSSTSIEGNPLNEQQVQKLLQGKTIIAPDYAIIEILNYKRALDWVSKKVDQKNQQPITGSDVLALHQIVTDTLLPKEKSGHWRPGDVFVVDEVDGKEIIQFTGPESKLVPKLVNSFLKWISSQQDSHLHPVLLAGLIHYIFVSIHPFSDGNGRTTRLLTYYYLKLWGYDFRGSLSLDSFYLQHRLEYYQALSRGETFDERMTADITPFLEFFVDGFLEIAAEVSKYIQIGKITDQNSKPVRLNAEELHILDFIYQFGSISVTEATDILSLPKRTTQRRLMELVDKKILSITDKGPSTRYVLNTTKK